ncbi:MAG TPA: hypothetical protein VGF95_12735 [Solirubrobacteraceae bacterium]
MTVRQVPAQRSSTRLPVAHALLAGATALLICLIGASAAPAALVTFGSSLSVPASLNTTENLGYEGTCTPVAGAGCIRTAHDGADTALWNVASPGGAPVAPGSGEIVKLKLEGCAERAKGAPQLSKEQREVHFQNLRKLANGSFQAESTSYPFEMPVCGEGASASTISTFEPPHFCIAEGEYLDFNDSGWFSEPYYRAGVPYSVIGSVRGAAMDSFISVDGAGTGATFSPSETNAMYGFASNEDEELMLQATVSTAGSYFCKGSEAPPPSEKKSSEKGSSEKSGSGKSTAPKKTETVKLLKKSTKLAKKSLVSVSLSCSGNTPCTGTLVLKAKTAGKGGVLELGHAKLQMADGAHDTVSVSLGHLGRKRMRAAKGWVSVAVTVKAADGVPTNVGTLLLRK